MNKFWLITIIIIFIVSNILTASVVYLWQAEKNNQTIAAMVKNGWEAKRALKAQIDSLNQQLENQK